MGFTLHLMKQTCTNVLSSCMHVQRMSDIYNGFSLMKCNHCGRTMRPEALVRHQKACTAENPMKGAGGAAAAAAAAKSAGGPSPAANKAGGAGAVPGGAGGNGGLGRAAASQIYDSEEDEEASELEDEEPHRPQGHQQWPSPCFKPSQAGRRPHRAGGRGPEPLAAAPARGPEPRRGGVERGGEGRREGR